MKQYYQISKLLLFGALVMMLASCASLNVSAMIPDAPDTKNEKPTKTLSITDVSGGNDITSSSAAYFVDNEKFKEALTTSMKQSGIFRNVTDNGGDMTLSASIKEQYVGMYAGGETFFIAKYQLYDAQTRQLVWKETYQSECSGKNFFHGIQCAIKTNITAMTQRLKEFLFSRVAVSERTD